MFRTFFSLLAGPMIIYGILMGHVICRVAFQTPGEIQVEDFPSDISKADKANIIKSRNALIEATKKALEGTFEGDYVTKYGSSKGMEFEDPIQKYEGDEEMRLLFDCAGRHIKEIEFDVKDVKHGKNEIVLDWSMNIYLNILPNYPLFMPMRSHLMLDKKEKVWRMYEEWKGNKQLNEETTISILGKVHEKLRRFVGYLGAETIRRGWI